MAESDPANPRVGRSSDSLDKLLRAIQTVGFPIVVAAFLLWEWHSTVNALKDTMTEVKLLLIEVKHEMKGGNR